MARMVSIAPFGVTELPLDRLRQAPWNANRVDEETLAKVRRSIETFGVVENLVVRPLYEGEQETGEWEVLSGNHRLGLYRELGLDSAPCHVVFLEDAEARILAQVLNRTRGTDDPDAYAALLRDVLRDVPAGDVVQFLPETFESLEEILGDLGTAGGSSDPADRFEDTPELPQKAKSRRGRLYELGDHRVLCADALDVAALEKLYADVDVAMVLADPPYGIDLDTDYTSMGTGSDKAVLKGVSPKRYPRVRGDDAPFDASPLVSFFAEVNEQFWFGGDYYRRTLSDDDRDGSWLVWDKRNEASDAGFGSGFELVWSRQRHKRDLLRHYYFGAFGADARGRVHPTQKPTPLLAEIIERWAPAEGVIADPFLGSGSTLIAAEKLGRVCYGLEIEPAYCDVIRQRYADLVGDTSFAP